MAEIDIAAVFQLLGSVAQDVRGLKQDVSGLKHDVSGLKHDMSNVKADLAGVRQTLTEYHASVLGHGVMISDLEDRVRRIERHLNLPPAAAE
ncbi:MAG TPA: hypothetical protein VLL76_03335 [Candidatus Omnitrophota bacterium]|nr:hypothetical protein [Candidatus Omnitrophota bacterium]